ncbi:MAG: class I SAM-dependent methyltransferase [Pseudomonadota bacterium]|nr:class I SAM-dependent methyltransferase [Pseudomonadota bacterium]
MYRESVVKRIVSGMRVLDCGGVDHWAFEQKSASGEWLHDIICTHATSCLGVDILDDNVRRINDIGKYRFEAKNVESMDFSAEFDVVVAGEIIEHIYNAGLFLDSCWRALKPDGKLLITTPNAYSLSAMLSAIFFRKEMCHPEHTCYYSRQTLRYIVSRHGFEIEELHVLPRRSNFKLIEWMRGLLSSASPLVADTLVLVAKKLPQQNKYTGKW